MSDRYDFWAQFPEPSKPKISLLTRIKLFWTKEDSEPEEDRLAWLLQGPIGGPPVSVPKTDAFDASAFAHKEIPVRPETYAIIEELRKLPTSLIVPLPRGVKLSPLQKKRIILHVQRLLSGYYKVETVDPHNEQEQISSRPGGSTNT